MLSVDLKTDPSAVGLFMKSPRCREICHDVADMAMMLYQAEVAKRSGALARTAHARTEIGGRFHDRWIGVMSASSAGVAYEAAHEFGYQKALPQGTLGPREFIPGFHDMNVVLGLLGSM
jgi:hypothetical protein